MDDLDISLGSKLLLAVYTLMPFLFGIGFLAPLIWQVTDAMGWTPPFGLSPLNMGLIIGGIWGAIAQLSGRWI